ncbi:ABC multidrug transporter [Hypoxylon crocopeplum]|nr:ABC multidrug transporter [Hypoxylon crocopeplum]
MAEFVVRSLSLDGDTLTTTSLTALGQVNSTLLIWATTFVVWPAVLLLSAGILLLRRLRRSKAEALDEDESAVLIQTRIPIFYDILQQSVLILLLTLTILGCVKDGSSTVPEACVIGYTLVLDATRILVARSRGSRSAIVHHVNSIVFIDGLIAFIQLSPHVLFIGPQTQASLWLSLKFAASLLRLLIAFMTPREWTPPRLSFELAHREQPAPSPEQTCSYFSYFISYGWLTDIILKGARRRLVMADMLPVPEYDEPLIWRERILEARKRFKTTLKTLVYTLRHNIGTMVFFAALTAVVEFIAPLGLYQLLNYIQNPAAATIRPWLWVSLLFLGPTLRSISYQQYIFSSTRLVVRTRLCLIQEIYAKAARVFDTDDAEHDKEIVEDNEDVAKQGIADGKQKPERSSKSESITNLMAYDVDAIWSSRDFILVCTASPIEVTMGVAFLYFLFGPCSLIALAVMLLSFPIATLLSRKMSGFQREVMKKTDRRVSLISEYLSSIRTIKYLGWEDIMAKNINAERREEEILTWRRNLTAVAVAVLGDFVPLFALFSMFAVDTLVLGHPLTASRAFTALSIIETLRLQFVWIANVTRFISQALIAFGRIDKFMLGEQETVRHPEGPPTFYSATFRRSQHQDSFRLRVDGNFVVGGLNVIAGASGSGKSSLLLSMLGETILEDGSATCPRDVSYSSQIPWLINDTIRANILLHEELDEKRYNRVIDACGLCPDLERFESKDLTNVGVNGSNLSGGQRQRVCLARAVYARSEILLLDDVFSALDSVTQKHVWEKCFHKDILQGRTVILVTQMQAAKDGADLVMELAHGRVVSTVQRDGIKQNLGSPLVIRQIPLRPKRPTETITVLDKTPRSSHGENIEEKVDQEIAGQGRNSRVLFWHYMLFFGGTGRAMLAMILCLLSQLAFFAIPLWLSVWVGASSREDAQTVGFYVTIYGAWLLSFSAIFAISHAYLQWGARKAAHTLHEKLVTAALWVSVHWYDKNPPGRLINRFSSDTYSLDSVLVEYLRIAIDNIFRFMLRLTAIGSIMPVFALPAAFICSIGLVCAEMYTRAQLSVKALTSASQSPIFSFFVESLAGKAVVRARSGMQEAFADDLARRLRVYARAGETQYNLNRWICVRADGCAAVIALFTGIIAVAMGSSAPAGRLGFSLTSAIGLGQTILTMVRNMNELEAELNCFYRIREYASLPLENGSAEDQEVPDSLPESWPSQGKVEFRGVTAKYALDGPDILQDLSLTIRPGERVAVVGRTGSGKSTLALSLLGFTNVTKGEVLVDGVDISTVPLRVLRRRLTIIPQEPVLFGSDVRFNLDPAQTAPDEHLTEAIDACSVVESLGAPQSSTGSNGVHEDAPSQEARGNPASTALNLDTLVAPGGSNFSVGQRQVLSLARATVRRSKVVVLDEATASLDHVSDAAIQQVLRSAFSGKTILAIVHRLSTIMDYDRVVVMGSGKVCEVGPPLDLYQKKGIFYSMVRQSIEHGRGGEWTPEKVEMLEPTDVHS